MGHLWDNIILYDNLSRLEILDGIIWDIYIYITEILWRFPKSWGYPSCHHGCFNKLSLDLTWMMLGPPV